MKAIHLNVSNSDEEIIKVNVDTKYCTNLHHHHEMQISYFVNCHGDFIVEDYKGHFSNGDVFIIGANQAHVFKNKIINAIESEGIRMYTIFLDLDLLHKYFSHIFEFQFILRTLKKFNSGAKISGTEKKKLADLIIKTVESTGTDRLIAFFSLVKSIEEIEAYEALSVTDFSGIRSGFDNQRLDKVLAFTKENLNRSIRLEEAAEVAFLTPESFCKYFKNKTGKTYIQYVNELRVNRASRFLIQEDYNLSEICTKVGFTNMSYFNRIFKKIKGSTPKEFQVSLA
jgi:AraC-like DNA-binding protein